MTDRDPGEAAALERLHLRRAEAQRRVAAMEGDLAALVEASRDSNADDEHDPEGQTIAYERAQLTSLLDRTRRLVDELEAATARVAAGGGDRCAVCGEPLSAERLEARPGATTCVPCAERAGLRRR